MGNVVEFVLLVGPIIHPTMENSLGRMAYHLKNK